MVQSLSTVWTVRGSNTGEGKVVHTRPDQPWGPTGLLYSGHWVAFQGVMARKAWTTLHALLSNAQFKAIAALRLWDFMAYFGVTFIFHNIGVANYIRESKHNRSTKLISHLNITIF
jgi:hypothetical protein